MTDRIAQIGPFRVTTLVTGRLRENCYLVHHLPSSEQVLVDPGADHEHIEAAVDAGGGKLRHVLLTHGHFDHVGAVAKIHAKYGATCQVHQGDVRLLRQAPFWAIRFVHLAIEQPRPFEAFDNAGSFAFGEGKVSVVPTPGHTQGSVCLAMDGFVFTGDTLFYRHIGPTNYPESAPQVLRTSISSLLAALEPETIIFPGHGRPWTIADARQWWSEAGGDPPTYNIMRDLAQSQEPEPGGDL